MPVNDDVLIDTRTAAVRDLIEYAKDQPVSQEPYRAAHAARAAALARRERMRAIARLPRKNVASRPWQSFGLYRTKQDWVDAGSPQPVEPTRRQKVEARLRLRKR